ncbi:MAG: hypothetical protein KJ000_32195 [Pirellulaceae bacterium]|nr:hypothetical protein [Pirellulaceae bacterium]
MPLPRDYRSDPFPVKQLNQEQIRATQRNGPIRLSVCSRLDWLTGCVGLSRHDL